MKIIFLDIDGVLNTNREIVELTPRGYVGLDDKLVQNLNTIVEKTNAKIVLTSTWKAEWNPDKEKCGMDALYLIRKLKECGTRIIGKTYDNCTEDRFFEHRGEGIRAYLLGRADIESYVIIDDNVFSDFDEMQHKRLIKTDSTKGLTKEDVETAIDILEA